MPKKGRTESHRSRKEKNKGRMQAHRLQTIPITTLVPQETNKAESLMVNMLEVH